MPETVRGQRLPAPAPLALVQEFCNTTWLRTGDEALGDPAALGRWLTAHGMPAAPTGADLSLALDVRAAFRALIDKRPATFGALAVRPEVDAAGRLGWVPVSDGVPGALARMVIA